MQIVEHQRRVSSLVMGLTQAEHDGFVRDIKMLADAGVVKLGEENEVGGIAKVTIETSRGVSVALQVVILVPEQQAPAAQPQTPVQG